MKLGFIIEKYHWFVWVGCVFYSLAKFKESAEKHFFSLNHGDFRDEWAIINRPKDASDFEWLVLSTLFKKFWPMLLFEILLSALFRKITNKALPFFYSFYSTLCLTVILGEKATLCLLLHITIMFITHLFGKKSICYILTLCALILKNSSYISDIKASFVKDENESFLFDIAHTWIMAKSLSFMCDRINLRIHNHASVHDVCTIVSYCLYLPTVFTGPIINYEPFVKQMDIPKNTTTFKAVMKKIRHLCYILLCYVAYEIMLHFLYSSAIQYYPDIASEFNSWSLCGLGYALPVMFFFKYFIIYSLAGSISSFENFELPPPPKCISCIHSSAYLWRHFDRGLYIWILRYLYHPLMAGKHSVFKRIYSLAACFAFVCLWHSVDRAVCMWTFLNFLLVSHEMLINSLLSSRNGGKKFYAVWITPNFLMMCISSIFFLSNWDIGVLVLKRVMLTGVIPFLPVVLIMYCGVRVSMDVRQWEKKHHCSCD